VELIAWQERLHKAEERRQVQESNSHSEISEPQSLVCQPKTEPPSQDTDSRKIVTPNSAEEGAQA
jgi:hypothetical protein